MKRAIISLFRRILKAFVPVVYFRPFRPQDTDKDKKPRRLLFLHPGHIGDVVLSTAVIPVVRDSFPDAEIGFAVGSWSAMVVDKHPEIIHVHIIDHWRLNRASIGFIAKMLRFIKTRRKAIQEIISLGYDTAISLYNFDPNLLDVAWAAHIPTRIAFEGRFFSALATRVVPSSDSWFLHQSERQALVLEALPISNGSRVKLHATLAADTPEARDEVDALFDGKDAATIRYRIVHIGAGAPMKEMPVAFWRAVVRRLSSECTVLFTGRGERESRLIVKIMEGLPNCINACDRLSWDGLVAAIRSAEVLYGVDSTAGHVAAAVGTRSIMAYHGAFGVARWRPAGDKTIVFTNHLECAPCLLPNGCSDMRCKEIDPDDLVNIDL